jgi:oligopeptide transport system permease protein
MTFFILRIIPGGPFDSERKPPPGVIENIEARYNLNAPITQQYSDYMGNIVLPRISDSGQRKSATED